MWDGSLNLRDLGGLPLLGGGTTRAGRLYRSGSPDSITSAGWERARAAGLRTVVDLRNDAEVERVVMPPDIVRVSAPTEAPDDPEFVRVCGPWLDHPRYYPDNARLFPHLIGTALAAIADTDGPTLVHCAAGRDRTGLVVSAVLALNGVESKAIADDYERGVAGFAAASGASAPDDLAEWTRPRRAALLAWLDHMSALDFTATLGLSPARRNRLATLLR